MFVEPIFERLVCCVDPLPVCHTACRRNICMSVVGRCRCTGQTDMSAKTKEPTNEFARCASGRIESVFAGIKCMHFLSLSATMEAGYGTQQRVFRCVSKRTNAPHVGACTCTQHLRSTMAVDSLSYPPSFVARASPRAARSVCLFLLSFVRSFAGAIALR